MQVKSMLKASVPDVANLAFIFLCAYISSLLLIISYYFLVFIFFFTVCLIKCLQYRGQPDMTQLKQVR